MGKMRILLFIFAATLCSVLVDCGRRKKIHLKIHVPKILKHHHHTKLLVLHKPKPHHHHHPHRHHIHHKLPILKPHFHHQHKLAPIKLSSEIRCLNEQALQLKKPEIVHQHHIHHFHHNAGKPQNVPVPVPVVQTFDPPKVQKYVHRHQHSTYGTYGVNKFVKNLPVDVIMGYDNDGADKLTHNGLRSERVEIETIEDNPASYIPGYKVNEDAESFDNGDRSPTNYISYQPSNAHKTTGSFQVYENKHNYEYDKKHQYESSEDLSNNSSGDELDDVDSGKYDEAPSGKYWAYVNRSTYV